MNYLIGKQKIYESAFYPYGDGIITLILLGNKKYMKVLSILTVMV